MARIALIVSLLLLLAASTWFAASAWTHLAGPPMPGWAYAAMAFGILFSIAVGSGLMALVFYSSRHGYDDEAGGRLDRD